MIDVPYVCPKHGTFTGRFPVGRYRLHVQCPQCGELSLTSASMRKHGDEGVPALQCDVRSPYFSDNLGKVVGSKREIRDEHKRLEREGYVPLTAADRKLSTENAWKRSNQAKRDIKEVEKMMAAGDLSLEKDDAPTGPTIG